VDFSAFGVDGTLEYWPLFGLAMKTADGVVGFTGAWKTPSFNRAPAVLALPS